MKIHSIFLFSLLVPAITLSVFSNTARAEEGKSTKLLFLGDSLTEGYGVSKDKSYPQWVKKKLEKKGLKVDILNGSISGSTTASSLSRMKWFLKAKPEVVFLALGANDGLRGIKVEESEKNLARAIELAQSQKLTVVLAGMMVPPNYGPDYGKKFKAMYPNLSKKYGVKLLPFLLEGVAGEKEFNQEDGIHPNEAGHEKMGEKVANFLYPLLKKTGDK
jgi:acyl-CoA thioesterase-1